MPLVKTIPGGALSAPVEDWPVLAADAEVPADGAVLVPLATWLAARQALKARAEVGVWLAADEDPAALAGDLDGLPVVAIRFAAFTDGRGYSLARLLRDRLGYRGELRAVGDVLIDQARFLARSGFDAFQVAAGTDLDRFAAALQRYSVVYQPAADGAAPAIALRHAIPERAAE